MKTNSTIYPGQYTESKGLLFIVDLDSVVEETKEDVITYTYDMYELPIAKRKNISEYIERNYETLLKFAIDKSLEPKPKSELEILQEQMDDYLTESI